MNPLFRDPMQPIPFDAIGVDDIKNATAEIVILVRKIKDEIVNSAPADRLGRLIKRDILFDTLDQVLAPVYLFKETHPKKDIRDASQASIQELFSFLNELSLDESLYQSLVEFAETKPDLSPVESRYLNKVMDNYQRNGFQLTSDDRAILKELDDQLNGCQLNFQKNISEGELAMFLTLAELEGLPQDFLQSRLQEDGRYLITTSKPDYTPVMKLAKNEAVRKSLYCLYNTRGQQNQTLLKTILELRIKRARLLGFDSYADYKLGSVMAQTPKAVWDFIKELSLKLWPKAEYDYQLLLENEVAKTLPIWSKSFATNNLKEERYQLDEEDVKCYFPFQQVCQGLFELAQRLYGVRFKEAPNLPVWHEDVQPYEMFDGDRLVGRIYFDMFPRPNKYNHAACFGIQSGRALEQGYQMPNGALVCNFPKPTEDRPSLLSHDEVETFFHEFGHLMHQVLTTAPLAGFAGTSVDRDFVEMPSQIMENWAWEKEALQTFARHYKTGEPIPDQLVNKMLAVKHLNSGIDTQQQLFYGAVDMTLHHGFEPESVEVINKTVARLQKELTMFEMPTDTWFEASFGHLVGYAAGYYGYLWSRVYADDMYSVFKAQGIFNPEVGRRFREEILASGGSRPPMDLITEFLGREPRMDAFLENLGVPA